MRCRRAAWRGCKAAPTQGLWCTTQQLLGPCHMSWLHADWSWSVWIHSGCRMRIKVFKIIIFKHVQKVYFFFLLKSTITLNGLKYFQICKNRRQFTYIFWKFEIFYAWDLDTDQNLFEMLYSRSGSNYITQYIHLYLRHNFSTGTFNYGKGNWNSLWLIDKFRNISVFLTMFIILKKPHIS